MKADKHTRIVSIVLILISSLCSQAQMMIPMTNTIRTPYGTSTYTTYNYVNYGNNYNSSYSYSTLPRNINAQSEIVLLNDSTLRGTYNFNAEGYIHTMTLVPADKDADKPQFEPTATKEIRILLGKQYVTGIPLDSCWLFKIVTGKINGYSRLPYNRPVYTAVRYIQKGNGYIEELTKENLINMVADNPRAVKLAVKRRWSGAIQAYNAK